MRDFHVPGFLKTKTTIKVLPFILTVAALTPSFAETLSSGGGTTGAPSSSASSSELLPTRIASPGVEDGQSTTVTLPEVVEGTTPLIENLNDATATEVTEVSTPKQVWESLEALSQSDRENARIALETASPSDAVQNAQSLWNSGSFDQAIEEIRSLEESGNAMGVGISWKIPKTVLSANWGNSDSPIGSRTDISKTNLDFDAQNGNLFTVLSGNTTGWTVNISSNGGTTWQETYTWLTSVGVEDTSAAVVGNYLWVGYVFTGSASEARMRRINVSDGSVDSAYGYKVIFDKGRPIKEIVVFSNADSYDNRVYYSAILDDYTTVLNNIVATQTSASKKIAVDDASKVDQAAAITIGTSKEMLAQLVTNIKLRHPNEILKALNDGEKTTRVIINLVNPNKGSTTTNAVSNDFSDIDARDMVSQEIKSTQDHVFNAMDKTQVKVTNTFKYIYGFSAEVTAEGLASLVNNPDVLSVEPDTILHPHGAQAIPQMNATAARTNYSGAGMSIAICDTGVDYTHSMLGGGSFPNSKVIGGYDTGDNDNDPMDTQGHGTSVAGIAAGTLGTSGDYIGGVAYDAKLYAIKISYGTAGSATTSDMVEGWEWAITHQNDDPSNPIMIINTSFGGGEYTDEATCNAASTAMATAAANAKAAGITLFVSTGNDGLCNATGWPGCLSDVIGVGAVYDADIGAPGWCVSANSCATKVANSGCSTGYAAFETSTALDQVTLYSNSASFMEIFAPSNNAYTTELGGGYTPSFGGTSAASPYAAGAGAVLQSAHHAKTGSYLTPDQLQAALIDTGDAITDGKVAITKPRVNVGNIVAAIDNLTMHYGSNVDTSTPTWIEGNTGIGNAYMGLDATTINTPYTNWWGYLSYIATNGSNNPLMVLRHSDSAWEPTEVLSDYTGLHNTTSISAYGDTIIVAYEHLFTNPGIRYSISYNTGDTWNHGEIFQSVDTAFYNPSVTARGGQGTAIVYDEEAGAFDPVWYRFRSGYVNNIWDTAVQVNEHDVATALPNIIQWLPSSASNDYGVIYLDSSSSAYFDTMLKKENTTSFLPAVYYLLFN
jgi:subtilisin family serine protease